MNHEDIPVVILCGGRGTRLKEETEVIPKPLVQIGGKPILWHIMKMYGAHGFREFILPVGYKGEKIKEYFLNYGVTQGDFTIDFTKGHKDIVSHSPVQENWKVTIVDTGLNVETGARLKRVEPYLKQDVFLLTYGDGVSNVDISAILRFHKEQGRLATVTGVRPPARFGGIAMEDTLAVNFWEKPQLNQGYINGGFFALNRDVLNFLKDEEKFNFEKHVLPVLAQQRQLAVYCHDGYWQCMDTLRDAEFLQEEWEKGSAPWNIWEN